MGNPLISVLTPFYNVAPYLEEAIESVLHQTYSHWELLLVDDGSADGSREIALKYAELFPEKIRYFRQEGGINKGTPVARNLAVKHAEGEYLALLDSDDYWLERKLAYQISIAQQYPDVSMICGASLYWYSWADQQKEDIIVPVGGPQNEPVSTPIAALSLYPLGKGAAPCPCSILVRKDAVIGINGFEECFVGDYQFYEDQAFLIKIYLHHSIYISSLPMDQYRQRPDSVMSYSTSSANYIRVRKYFLKWLTQYLNENKISYPDVNKKLREALLPYERPFLYKIKRLLQKS